MASFKHQIKPLKGKLQAGFSTTELVIAIAISAIVLTVLFSVTVNYYFSLVRSEITTDMALGSQTALTQIIEDLRLSSSIAVNNQINDPNAPSGGWSTSDPDNVLIINIPATDSSNDIIYNDLTGDPYTNEYIYFIEGNKLYKRSLKNTAATGNTTETTCPPESATATCPADRLFSDKASDLHLTFYDNNDAATTDPLRARSVLLGIDMSKTVYGKPISMSNSTQVTLRN